MISGVLNERERREIRTGHRDHEQGRGRRPRGPARLRAGQRERAGADHTALRLARLREICQLGETMLDMLLGELNLDVGRFRDVLKVQ
jgi:hypothetical protein